MFHFNELNVGKKLQWIKTKLHRHFHPDDALSPGAKSRPP
jgi:hypothetical protein